MSTVLGIDFSSVAVDCVLLDADTDQAIHHRVDLAAGPGDAFDRCRRIRDLMPPRTRWLDEGVLMAAIEQPFSRSFKSTAALLRVQGAVIACLPREMPLVPLPAVQWKQETVGRSNADKDAVRAWVLERWPDAPSSYDACDAYAIAWAVRKLCEAGEVIAAA